MNTPYFEYDLCNFTEKNMYSKDKSDGLSKEGSGRVALFKQTKINLCYTLECNYNMGSITNKLNERVTNYSLDCINLKFLIIKIIDSFFFKK